MNATDAEYDEQEARAERISQVKKDLADDLNQYGVSAFPFMLENDVLVEGPLSVIMEFCQANRSEIEELGL